MILGTYLLQQLIYHITSNMSLIAFGVAALAELKASRWAVASPKLWSCVQPADAANFKWRSSLQLRDSFISQSQYAFLCLVIITFELKMIWELNCKYPRARLHYWFNFRTLTGCIAYKVLIIYILINITDESTSFWSPLAMSFTSILTWMLQVWLYMSY